MAYSKNPEQSTYKTQRFNFVGSPQQRSGDSVKDQRFINLIPEVVKTEATKGTKYYLKSRAGTSPISNVAITGEGRGVYVFTNLVFMAVGNKVYRNNVEIITWTTSTGKVGFAEGDASTYNYLFISDGVNAYVVKEDGTTTKVVAADFPTPHLPFPVFIDGFICLVKTSTGDIYNSNLNDPLLWTAGDFISAEMFPDNVTCITKHLNYVLAFGSATTELFYNVANASGTPFERNSGAVQMVGCIAPQTASTSDNVTVFVGNDKHGGNSVYILEGFKLTDVGTEAIREAIDYDGPNNVANAHGYCIRTRGHRLYVLNLSTRTWVYDFEEKLWHEWQYNGTIFPFNYCSSNADNDSTSRNLFVHPSSGYLYMMADGTRYDSDVNMDCTVVTIKIDFDTYNRKFGYRFALIGDAPSPATSAYISWSDDDYQTFSTERAMLYDGNNAAITALGSFRRRAYKVRIRNSQVRLEGFELDVNMGSV